MIPLSCCKRASSRPVFASQMRSVLPAAVTTREPSGEKLAALHPDRMLQTHQLSTGARIPDARGLVVRGGQNARAIRGKFRDPDSPTVDAGARFRGRSPHSKCARSCPSRLWRLSVPSLQNRAATTESSCREVSEFASAVRIPHASHPVVRSRQHAGSVGRELCAPQSRSACEQPEQLPAARRIPYSRAAVHGCGDHARAVGREFRILDPILMLQPASSRPECGIPNPGGFIIRCRHHPRAIGRKLQRCARFCRAAAVPVLDRSMSPRCGRFCRPKRWRHASHLRRSQRIRPRHRAPAKEILALASSAIKME